ncbi:hypothetical protein Tco_1423551 [Tanacetum coccineum]
MQQHGRGLVTSHFRRTFMEQLASAEGDLRPQVTIIADPYPTRVQLWPLQLKLSQSLGLVQDLARRKLEGSAQQAISPSHTPPASNATLREYCDKHYHQLLPIIAEKVHNEKVQQEKLKEVKARLNFEGCSGRNSNIQETSQYSESRTPNKIGDLKRRLKPRCSRSMSRSPERTSVFSRIQRDRSVSPRRMQGDKRRREGNVFHRLGDRGRSLSAHSESRYQGSRPRRAEPLSESEEIEGGHWKSKSRKQKSSMKEEDLSQPWTCKEENPFTPRIRYFKILKKSRMPNNVKTYDGSYDPEDHLKIFQVAVKVERWAMPT